MAEKKPYRAAWLLSGAARGSGGFRTVLVHAQSLANIGIISDFYFYDKHHDVPVFACDVKPVSAVKKMLLRVRDPEAKIRSKITRMGIAADNIHLGWSAHAAEITAAHAVFATTWSTAYEIERLQPKGKRFYFLQAREDYVNALGEMFIMAQNSFRKDFHFVTIGPALCHNIRKEFGMPANYFDFGADLSVYKPLQHVAREPQSVAFIFQPKKTDRCPRIGLEALRLVKQARPHVKIYLYGSRRHQQKVTIPFDAEHLGLLDVTACNELYNRASVGLCMSGNNPSRISFEMMAAGLPTVELYGDNTRYLFPDSAMFLAHPEPQSIAKALLKLLDDDALRHRMGQAGVKFMQSHDMKKSETAQFCDIVKTVMAGKTYKQPEPQPVYKGEKII